MKHLKNIIRDNLGLIYYNAYKRFLKKGNRCLIYHAFGSKIEHDTYGISININKFKDHIKYLTDNFPIANYNDFNNEISISLSIDDGYEDTNKAIDILIEYKFPFSLFITSGNINKKGYLCKNDIINISKIENSNIGTHGAHHVKLGTVDNITQYEELKASKDMLEDILGQEVLSLSYPHGSYNLDTLDIVKQLGYKWAACSQKGFNRKDTNRYLLNRSEIISSDTPKDLLKKIEGYYDYY